jgi:transcriptional regulator with XRE-family HTH domain
MDYIEFRQLLGQRVSNIRKEKHITQEKLAELIDKTTEHMSFIERGERSPSFETLIDLSAALGVPLSFLMDIDSDNFEVSSMPAPIPTTPLPDPVEDSIKPKAQLKSDLERMQRAFGNVQELQSLADEYGITDIFQDNGGKVLQVLIILGLKTAPGREGNDAVDEEGKEYELKTLNIALNRNGGFTTHHHLTKDIIDKYRKVKAWCFAIYEGIELIDIWKLHPSELEPWFVDQERWIDEHHGQARNNPKIPLRYVRRGERVYHNPNKPEGPTQITFF